MRMAIYHCRPIAGTAVLTGLALASAALAAPPDRGATIAEGWLEVADATSLREAESVGLTVAEGMRVLPDGGIEQRVLVSPRARSELESRGFSLRIERPDHRRGPPRDGYSPPAEGDERLRAIAARSDRSGLVQLGESRQGRPILGMWLGEPPDAGAPTLRVLGAHHGDEWSSFEVALDVADTLVERDGTDPAITGLLDDSTVWVVPYVNPDGVAAGSRYNADDVDLNRNYDFEWSPYAWRAGPEPFSEPETRAVRLHALTTLPLASLSLHSGAANIGYVWNYSTAATPEEPLLAVMAEQYGDTCTMPGFWVTNGADWYTTTGDTNDWSYGRYGGMDFTLELTETKAPEAAEIPVFTADHREAVLEFLTTPVAVSGRVVDADTGAPLPAALQLWTPDGGAGSRTFYSDPGTGRFHRIATGAARRLQVRAPGFAPVEIDVDPGAPGTLDLEVALAALSVADALPEPRLLRPGSVEVTFPGRVGEEDLRLFLPGAAGTRLTMTDGVARIDSTDLAPGVWTAEVGDGTAWPRALVVPGSGVATLASATATDDTLALDGSGFAEGTRAWGLSGALRSVTPLPVASETNDRVVIDLSGLPHEENVDVIALSNGTMLGVLDVHGAVEVDTGSVADDTGVRVEDDLELVAGGCGCAAASPVSGWWPLWMTGLLAARRRRT